LAGDDGARLFIGHAKEVARLAGPDAVDADRIGDDGDLWRQRPALAAQHLEQGGVQGVGADDEARSIAGEPVLQPVDERHQPGTAVRVELRAFQQAVDQAPGGGGMGDRLLVEALQDFGQARQHLADEVANPHRLARAEALKGLRGGGGSAVVAVAESGCQNENHGRSPLRRFHQKTNKKIRHADWQSAAAGA